MKYIVLHKAEDNLPFAVREDKIVGVGFDDEGVSLYNIKDSKKTVYISLADGQFIPITEKVEYVYSKLGSFKTKFLKVHSSDTNLLNIISKDYITQVNTGFYITDNNNIEVMPRQNRCTYLKLEGGWSTTVHESLETVLDMLSK